MLLDIALPEDLRDVRVDAFKTPCYVLVKPCAWPSGRYSFKVSRFRGLRVFVLGFGG